jgi:hypothetical protein
MAVQNTRTGWANEAPAGEKISNPTQASGRPVEQYRSKGSLYRGVVDLSRTGADGKPLAQSKYGQNGYTGAVSCDVEIAGGPQGTGLCDLDASPPSGDGTLAHLVKRGFGDHDTAAVDGAVADLSRKINPNAAVPDAFGSGSARARQASSHSHLADKVLGAIERNAQENPIRTPSGGKL